jgi:hypothetical protein
LPESAKLVTKLEYLIVFQAWKTSGGLNATKNLYCCILRGRSKENGGLVRSADSRSPRVMLYFQAGTGDFDTPK